MAFARANLFSTDRVLRERYRFGTADWTRLYATLARHHGRGALVGPKGSGKTTLLEDLGQRLTQTGRPVTLMRLSAEFPHLPASYNRAFFANLSQRDALLLDGAEQLSLVRWLWFRRLTRRAGCVVVTTHRAGRLPLLHRCNTSPELLSELVFSLGHTLSTTEAEALHRRHHGNIREALRELYDRYAENNMRPLSFSSPRV